MSTSTPVRTARSKGLRESLLDMGRSLGLMAVIMIVVLLVTPARGLIFPDRNDRMPPVDYSSQVSGFRQVTGHPALVPPAVPSGWRANAARLGRGSGSVATLHIGWAIPGDRFLGLDETNGDGTGLVRAVLGARGVATDGVTTIGPYTWQQRTSDRGERSLTTVVGGVTVVVTGNPTKDQLDRFCASLR